MTLGRARSGWDGRLALPVLALALFSTGCATVLPTTSAAPVATHEVTASDDDDYSQFVAQLRADLNRYNSREVAQKPTITPQAQTATARDREFSNRAKALFAPLNGTGLHMPVVGVMSRDLDDSWHAPRDGGERLHTGID